MSFERLSQILDLVDQANAKDPHNVAVNGHEKPAELIYGQRMSSALDKFCTAASDHLRIAVRAQHIERWSSPRKNYPDGRAGYLKWRSELMAFHARRTSELMQQAEYEQADIDRVAVLITKKGLKRDPEVQILEDVICLVFLEHYAADFIAKHDDAKVLDILKKTARKMSANGVSAAGNLALPDRLAGLLNKALTES